MTGQDGQKVSPTKWASDRFWVKFYDTVIGWVIVAVVGGGLMLVSEGFRSEIQSIWNSPKEVSRLSDAVERNGERLANLSDRVRVLSQPRDIFDISVRNTGPVDGYCIENRACRVQLRIRRLPESLACQIVRGSVQWGFINPRSDTFVAAQRVDDSRGRNVGATWEYLYITLMIPPGLEPEADFTFEAFYTDCPGTSDTDDPISRRSPRVPFKIYADPPD
ncbi:hypothetical protein FIU97_14560 [Roseivivax sp. THAF40]|uniref:hypothetical protein n=1 Tax=Roseivivax sp. THAF40 TaxID=2587858 RepID=UPI001268B57F|nr:hypothetical protein [Roseivivax sp. THAF40]QFT47801.1 hypothetical protein FIU97_14560 [Roseivivax sp. THAF40]